MALQLWLPLDGTLENKGCADVTVVNNGATINAVGKIGSCYSFDGNDDYIMGEPAFLNNNTQEWSYACWFKPVISHPGCLFSNRTAVSYTGISLFYSNGNILFDDGARWQFTPSKAISINNWNHLVFTRSQSGKKFYLNGELINSTATIGTPTIANSTKFSIGMSQSNSTTVSDNRLNGQLNDIRVYDHCLSAAEVKEISQGLILHYKLDNIIDNIRIIDSSGYNHHGSIKNTVEIETDTTRYLKSINLPNGNSAINCGRGGMVTDSITYSIWINYSTWGNPVSCTEGGGWNFETNPVQLAINIESIGYLHAVSSFQPTANEWHMLTGVYDRLNQKAYIYIDGQMTGETNASSPNLIHYNGSNVIWLGAEASGSATAFASNGMIGKISDFRIYCTALSAEDILDLYHTSAKIDKTGKVHTFEFVENEGTKITKTGITEWIELIEETGNAKFNSQYISANDFIEK